MFYNIGPWWSGGRVVGALGLDTLVDASGTGGAVLARALDADESLQVANGSEFLLSLAGNGDQKWDEKKGEDEEPHVGA